MPLRSHRVKAILTVAALAVLALDLWIPTAHAAGLRAFPGAEGFGAYAEGGRGGAVYIVTTLDDFHPGAAARGPVTRIKTGEEILPAHPAVKREEVITGSLRAAVEADEPRTIVFRVAGTIQLKAPLVIANPFITIAGQTAPGGGICLRDYGLVIASTHDVVVRHLRIRPGDLSRTSQDAICLVNTQDVIVDHCSTSWGVDENLSVSGIGTTAATVQWCIISESLNDSWHPKGPHGMGSLIRSNGTVSYHHNLYAHNNNRNPRPGTYGEPAIRFDFRNNVIYNWGVFPGYTAEDPATINYVGNYIKVGPALKTKPRVAFHIGGETTRMFTQGNVLVDGDTDVRDDWEIIEGEEARNRLKEPLPVVAMQTDSAEKAYEKVLASAGATLPKRDAVDLRVVADVTALTGAVIDSQTQVGSWPALDAGAAPADTDSDGMPDAWEVENNLNPRDPSDQALDRNDDGYTNLEEYVNGIPVEASGLRVKSS